MFYAIYINVESIGLLFVCEGLLILYVVFFFLCCNEEIGF